MYSLDSVGAYTEDPSRLVSYEQSHTVETGVTYALDGSRTSTTKTSSSRVEFLPDGTAAVTYNDGTSRTTVDGLGHVVTKVIVSDKAQRWTLAAGLDVSNMYDLAAANKAGSMLGANDTLAVTITGTMKKVIDSTVTGEIQTNFAYDDLNREKHHSYAGRVLNDTLQQNNSGTFAGLNETAYDLKPTGKKIDGMDLTDTTYTTTEAVILPNGTRGSPQKIASSTYSYGNLVNAAATSVMAVATFDLPSVNIRAMLVGEMSQFRKDWYDATTQWYQKVGDWFSNTVISAGAAIGVGAAVGAGVGAIFAGIGAIPGAFIGAIVGLALVIIGSLSADEWRGYQHGGMDIVDTGNKNLDKLLEGIGAGILGGLSVLFFAGVTLAAPGTATLLAYGKGALDVLMFIQSAYGFSHAVSKYARGDGSLGMVLFEGLMLAASIFFPARAFLKSAEAVARELVDVTVMDIVRGQVGREAMDTAIKAVAEKAAADAVKQAATAALRREVEKKVGGYLLNSMFKGIANPILRSAVQRAVAGFFLGTALMLLNSASAIAGTIGSNFTAIVEGRSVGLFDNISWDRIVANGALAFGVGFGIGLINPYLAEDWIVKNMLGTLRGYVKELISSPAGILRLAGKSIETAYNLALFNASPFGYAWNAFMAGVQGKSYSFDQYLKSKGEGFTFGLFSGLLFPMALPGESIANNLKLPKFLGGEAAAGKVDSFFSRWANEGPISLPAVLKDTAIGGQLHMIFIVAQYAAAAKVGEILGSGLDTLFNTGAYWKNTTDGTTAGLFSSFLSEFSFFLVPTAMGKSWDLVSKELALNSRDISVRLSAANELIAIAEGVQEARFGRSEISVETYASALDIVVDAAIGANAQGLIVKAIETIRKESNDADQSIEFTLGDFLKTHPELGTAADAGALRDVRITDNFNSMLGNRIAQKLISSGEFIVKLGENGAPVLVKRPKDFINCKRTPVARYL